MQWLKLTCERAAQYFQPHTKATIPGEWVNTNEAGNLWLGKLCHHRGVPVNISIKKLDRKEKTAYKL